MFWGQESKQRPRSMNWTFNKNHCYYTMGLPPSFLPSVYSVRQWHTCNRYMAPSRGLVPRASLIGQEVSTGTRNKWRRPTLAGHNEHYRYSILVTLSCLHGDHMLLQRSQCLSSVKICPYTDYLRYVYEIRMSDKLLKLMFIFIHYHVQRHSSFFFFTFIHWSKVCRQFYQVGEKDKCIADQIIHVLFKLRGLINK